MGSSDKLKRNHIILLLSWQCMLYLAPDDPDLKSFLEGGGPSSGGGCALIRKIEIAKKKRRKRQEGRGKKSN